MGTFKSNAYRILAENGISDPKPGQWYSQQAWLDAFKNIASSIGERTLFSIGLKIPENAKFPPNINSLAKALASIDVAYHMNHKGGNIGHYKFSRTGKKSGKMICDNPYPCSFDMGIISTMIQKFTPKTAKQQYNVTHDDSQPCRKKGADSCTYLIA